MNFGTFVLLTVVYSVLMFLIQRTEKRRRLVVSVVLVPIGLVTQWYAGLRGFGGEGVAAFILAMGFNFLFWVVVGRYNPVGSSDDIRVIGMDD